MNIPCIKATMSDGEHRLEFREDMNGVTVWVCMDCGESLVQYQDNSGR